MLVQVNDEPAYLSRSQVEVRRKAMDADVWLFQKWVCQPCRPTGFAVERFHKPLAYMLKSDAVRLAACLDIYQSELTRQIRADLAQRGIDYHEADGLRRFARLLRRINNRIARSMGKTVTGLDVVCHDGSVDPNITIGIASKSDPAAWGMCETVGKIMLAEPYAMYYGDRLFPRNPDSYITKKWIRMNGRTNPVHETIEARGIKAQWPSWHGTKIYADDIVGLETNVGEASNDDALRWISGILGISVAEGLGGSTHEFQGTIYGPNDDNAKLSSDPEFLSTRVPIWIKPVPSNISNLKVDGEPVLPEWYSVEDIRRMRAQTLASADQMGAISWLQNFELTAHEAGAMQFSAELLRRSKFEWRIREVRVSPTQTVKTRIIRRYLWTHKEVVIDGVVQIQTLPVLDPRAETKPGDCTCWLRCGKANHSYVEFDPLTLPRVIGIDQALSLQGDKWSIGCVAQDPFGFKYQLRGAADRGYRKMIAATPLIFNRWGGIGNPPRKLGIESGAWQSLTSDWMQRAYEFQFLANRVEKVSPGRIAKEARIFNNVLANMEMGVLLLDPDDSDRDGEMLKYNASAENPEDNILDSISIAVTLFGRPTTASDDQSERLAAEQTLRDWKNDTDDHTGVDLSTDFMDAMWN